jgi:hypothetical protein
VRSIDFDQRTAKLILLKAGETFADSANICVCLWIIGLQYSIPLPTVKIQPDIAVKVALECKSPCSWPIMMSGMIATDGPVFRPSWQCSRDSEPAHCWVRHSVFVTRHFSLVSGYE